MDTVMAILVFGTIGLVVLGAAVAGGFELLMYMRREWRKQ